MVRRYIIFSIIMNKYSINRNGKSVVRAGGVNFIRNVAAPKLQKTPQVQSSKYLGTPVHNHQPTHTSTLLITLQYPHNHSTNLFFSFNSYTRVADLLAFLKQHCQSQLVYFSSGNIHVDYFLSLEYRLVRELPMNKLKLNVREMVDWLGTPLGAFQIIKCIGSGGFSKVLLGRAYGLMMAIKIIDKEFIFRNAKESIIKNEKLILQSCSSHPFVTKLFMSFETDHYIVFCMEYCNGGELFNLLRKVKRMSQSDAKFYFLETLSAIDFLHSKGILYRDLKPENIIIDPDGHIRLADYGLSKIINDELTYSFCGSAEYMAPEMLTKKGHSYEIDYYCLGALLYQLVTGLPPFYSRDQSQLFENILNSELTFPSHTHLSNQIKDFLMKILEKNVNNRFKTISQIYEHPWVASDLNISDVIGKKMVPPYPTEMFIYNFDDSEFCNEEKKILKMIEEEKKIQLRVRQFSNFQYLAPDIEQRKKMIHKKEQQKFNFAKPKIKQLETRYHSRDNSRNLSRKSGGSVQRKNEIKSIEKHYFPTRLQRKTHTPHIQNEYLKGVKSSGNIHYHPYRNVFSPKSKYLNIYTTKQNIWSNGSYKKLDGSLGRSLGEKQKKLSVSLSKKTFSRQNSIEKSRSYERNHLKGEQRRGSDLSGSYSQGYLSNFREKMYPPKVKKSFRQGQRVNFYFPHNHR